MKREHLISVAVAAVLALAGLLVWGFLTGHSAATSEAQREEAVKPAVRVSQNPFSPPTLVLNPQLQKQAGVQLRPPQPAPYQQELQAYGSILELQSFTDLGNTLASATAQRAIAEAKVGASRESFERARRLYKNNQNFSRAQLQAAEATFQTDEASLRAAQVQARNAVASAYQMWGSVLGQSLASNTALAQALIRHKKLLIQVTLPLGISLPRAQENASIENSNDARIPIEFISAANRTDPRIQGASFFYTAEAGSGLLPGMNVIALLPAGRPATGIAIPASAVVWMQGRAWVYLRTGENAFTRHEISTAQPQLGGGYIEPSDIGALRPDFAGPPSSAGAAAQSFPTNLPLVVAGAQALLSQEFSAQIDVGGD